jgi:hypothetical protein
LQATAAYSLQRTASASSALAHLTKKKLFYVLLMKEEITDYHEKNTVLVVYQGTVSILLYFSARFIEELLTNGTEP